MPFEWDAAKRAANTEKHGVDFAAVADFDWDAALVRPDLRAAYGETRWAGMGPIDGVLHALVFVLRGQAVRVISLRRANRAERRRYAESRQAVGRR